VNVCAGAADTGLGIVSGSCLAVRCRIMMSRNSGVTGCKAAVQDALGSVQDAGVVRQRHVCRLLSGSLVGAGLRNGEFELLRLFPEMDDLPDRSSYIYCVEWETDTSDYDRWQSGSLFSAHLVQILVATVRV